MEIQEYINQNRISGIEYKAKTLFGSAITTEQREEGLRALALTLSLVQSSIKEEDYFNICTRVTKLKPKILRDAINEVKNDKSRNGQAWQDKADNLMPDWAEEKSWYQYGFDGYLEEGSKETGFYFAVGGGYAHMTNFVLKPIVHVYSEIPENNVRVTELHNGWHSQVIDMQTKTFLSTMDFENVVGNYGNYMCKGGFGKKELARLKEKLWSNYPTCEDLTQLGWQKGGFFAYSDKIYNKELLDFNEYGIVTIDNKNYISKSASVKKVISNSDDDPYENDRFLKYKQTDITFKKWANMMLATYGTPGWIGSVFAMMTLFRDIVFKTDNNCPLLYAYGEAQSGKSKYAESISNLFFDEMPAFNLNQGTDVAFWNRLMRFKNCPALFNEFDENAIKEEWFRALKAIYDGEGRERGTIKKGRSETQKVNCTVILMGQYMSTKDDNSVLSRTIPIQFRKQNERSAEVNKAYDALKDAEKAGLNGILVELLQHREHIKKYYADTFGTCKKYLTQALRKKDVLGETRIVGNYSHLLAMAKLMGPLVGEAVPYDDFFEHCLSEVMKLSTIMSESNTLSDFWRTVERLMDTGVIELGFDLKIEQGVTTVKKQINRDKVEDHLLEEPSDVLYIRLSNIHTPYMQLKRSATGKSGINQQTIETYMKDQPYWIGMCKSTQFKSKKMNKKVNTSCIMLKYDEHRQANFIREDAREHEQVEKVGETETMPAFDLKPDDKVPF